MDNATQCTGTAIKGSGAFARTVQCEVGAVSKGLCSLCGSIARLAAKCQRGACAPSCTRGRCWRKGHKK